MEFALFRNWTRHLLMTFLILLAVAHAQMAPSQNNGQVSCDELRQSLTANFLQSNQIKVPDLYLRQLLPKWVESLLPSSCVQPKDTAAANFNPASATDNGGPLGALGGTGTIYAMSTTRRKRAVEEQEDVKYELGVSRDKRSMSTTTVTEEDVTNLVDNASPLAREKRFLNGMSFGPGPGGPSPGGPPKEISESAQMFNTLLMFTKLQRNRWSQQTNRARSGNLEADRISFSNGMYGDPYPGRRKREVAPALEDSLTEANLVEEPNSRQKRFLFPAAEPGEGPPSMMSVMMGTAVDPNSGKRIDPAGDYAKNMMRQAFMASTPFGAMTPPGKEPPEFVKNAAPAWFFSQMQQAFNPQPAYPRSFRMMPHPTQRLQPGGYYGDRFPGKRKKRSTDAVNDMPGASEADSASTSEHDRQKRATSENANDVITVGDVSIPLDFFKPRERSDDIKYYDHRPRHYPPPQTYQPPRQQPQPQPPQSNYHNLVYQRNLALQRYHQQEAMIRYLYGRLRAQENAQQQARHHAAWAQPTQPTQPAYVPPQAPYVPPQTQPPHTQKPYVPPPPPQKPFVPPPPPQKPFVPPPQPPPVPASVPQYPPPNFSPHQAPPPPPFLDPFIHPPQGPPPAAQAHPPPSRKKRSDSSKKGSSLDNFFWRPSFFAPSVFNRRSYIPPYSSGRTNKIAYRSPKGTFVYGDRIPGAKAGVPPFAPRRPIVSPAIPRGWAGTRPYRPAQGRRVKRANKEFTDQPGYFSPLLPAYSPWLAPPPRPYVPPRYSPLSNKLSYRTGTGNIVYGDRFPGTYGRPLSYPHRNPYGVPRPGGLPPRLPPPRLPPPRLPPPRLPPPRLPPPRLPPPRLPPPRLPGLPPRQGGLPPRVGG